MRKFLILLNILILTGCSTMDYRKTVDNVDINRFMGDWYVIAGKFTFFEKGAHNSIETYRWNSEKNRIDVEFSFNKGSFEGKKKTMTQKAWIENKKTNAYWKVQPMWPLKLDYLIIALADDYSWTAVGVPSGKYLWIMAKDWKFPKEKVLEIAKKLEANGYPSDQLEYIPHNGG